NPIQHTQTDNRQPTTDNLPIPLTHLDHKPSGLPKTKPTTYNLQPTTLPRVDYPLSTLHSPLFSTTTDNRQLTTDNLPDTLRVDFKLVTGKGEFRIENRRPRMKNRIFEEEISKV